MDLDSADESVWAARLAGTAFAAALAEGAALVVLRDEPPRVAFATLAALATFGAGDAQALEGVVFAPGSLGARRLARLARQTPADGPARRMALCYFVARKPVSVSWAFARLSRDGETFLVAADVAAPAPTPARFVWRLDGEARFGAPDAALVERFADHSPRAGEALEAFGARVGLDSAWAERIAARQTFSGLSVIWPEPQRERGRSVLLSGAPSFGAGRDYQGFRGFGVIGEARVDLPSRAKPPPALRPVPGDAAALIRLLQRQHGAPLQAAAGKASAPALAVISALAALLQPKGGRTKPAAAPPERPAPEVPSSGAEIVVLRPHANAPAHEPAPRAGEGVALTAQERDAFKEIARALGVNVRPARPAFGAPEFEPEPPPASTPPPAEEDLAALLDILPLAALVIRGDAALYANKTLLDLTGYADLDDFCARDGLKAIFRGRDPRALAAGGVAGVPLVGANERILTVDALVRPAVWRGEPAELIALRRSLEAEHQAELRAVERETAMHAARARDLAVALDVARDGLVRLDRNGRILSMNKGAERLFGCHQNETAGDMVVSLLAPESRPEAAAALERLARGEAGPVVSLDALAQAEDGRRFAVRMDLGRLANMPEPDYFLLLTDRSAAESELSAAKAAREAAERASAGKTELLLRVSHEMRTPLHAVLGFAEVILEERFGPLGNERYRDYVRHIDASGRHVLSLANDLLDLSKIELGKIELQFVTLDVNSVVRDCIALMQPQAARERVIVRLSLYDRLPNVMADERSLRQILLNLIGNAVKYNEPGGQVIVSTVLDEAGHAVLRVRDTGVGMSESELALALEPFRRAPGVNGVEGVGLGLPITKALVEANHADFSIRSRKDQGTLVEIAFPALQAAQ